MRLLRARLRAGTVAVAAVGRHGRGRGCGQARSRLRAGTVAGAGQSRGLATRVPFLTSTASGFKGATAGSRSTLPVVTSNSLP